MTRFVFAVVRDRKTRLANKLRECAPYLHPGIWLLREPGMAHHALLRGRPASLMDTKGLKRFGWGWAIRIAHRVLFVLTPPFVVYVGRKSTKSESGQAAAFPIVVLARCGDAILLDHVRGKVLRLRQERSVDAEQVEIRERLGRFLAVPALEILEDGKVEREPYVEGRSFVRATSSARLDAAAELLRQLEKLTMAESRPAPGTLAEQVTGFARFLPLPATAFQSLEAVVGSELWDCPFTPAHGDLSGYNILLKDGRPRLIDLNDCAWLPAFSDFFFLNHQEVLAGRPDLWRHFMLGNGWGSMKKALQRTAATTKILDRTEWLVTSFFLQCFVWGRKAGAASLDEATLLRWWAPVGEARVTDGARRCAP